MVATDTAVVFIFASFFIVIGAVIPFMETAYGDNPINQSVQENMQKDLDSIKNTDSVSAWEVIKSITAMLFWSANINIWLQLIVFEPMRIVMYFSLARAILT